MGALQSSAEQAGRDALAFEIAQTGRFVSAFRTFEMSPQFRPILGQVRV